MKTPQHGSEGFFKDRGSTFQAFLVPVADVEAVENQLKAWWKLFPDATHICYAYRIGAAAQVSKAADDGEPAHTAGSPILRQLQAAELTNALCAVVRYFGGTKLGIRGLIDAYTAAAKEAIENNTSIVDFQEKTAFRLTFDYEVTGKVKSILNQYVTTLHQSDFGLFCLFEMDCNTADFEALRTQIGDLAIVEEK